MRLAMDRVAELSAAGIVACARHVAHALVGRHRVFGKSPTGQALVVAEFDPAEVHHPVHHRHLHVLAVARAIGLVQRRQEADRQMQSRAGIADLRTRDERRAIRHTCRAHRPAHRLGDVLVGLELGIGPGGTKALDRAHHDLRVDLMDLLPGEAEPVQHAGAEVLHDDVALLQEVDEHSLALLRFHVHRDRPLVAVEHGEIKAVGVRHVAQLAAGRIALRRLELDDVRAHPGEKLRAGRPRLHVRHVEDPDSLECFHSVLQKIPGRR